MSWLRPKRQAHPAATPVRLRPSVDISFTALLYFAATLFIGVAAMNSQTNLLFGVFGLMIGVLFVAGFISRFSLRRLAITRSIPEHLVVGEASVVSYIVRNQKRFWPSVSVSLGELDGCESFTRQPYAYVLHVAPQSSSTMPVPLLPKRRGVQDLDCYQISTSFPFGFVKRATVCHQKDRIVVFPALAQVDPKVLLLCQSAENIGSKMRPRKGGNDEFYGLREYRLGENPRLIHWKRSARTGDLVLREMTQVSPPRLLIAVDHFRDASEEQDAASHSEKAIAVAASLASLALSRNYPVGLLAWSGNWTFVRPSRGKRHRREVLTELARVGANRQQGTAALIEQASRLAEVGTTIVLITSSKTNGYHTRSRRTGLLRISTRDESMMKYFRFADGVDFGHSMPVSQESPEFAVSQPEWFESQSEAEEREAAHA